MPRSKTNDQEGCYKIILNVYLLYNLFWNWNLIQSHGLPQFEQVVDILYFSAEFSAAKT